MTLDIHKTLGYSVDNESKINKLYVYKPLNGADFYGDAKLRDCESDEEKKL